MKEKSRHRESSREYPAGVRIWMSCVEYVPELQSESIYVSVGFAGCARYCAQCVFAHGEECSARGT